MPSFRKLSPAEIARLEQSPLSARAEIARAYDVYLADFNVGDYGRIELIDGERRAVVRRHVRAAAKRRELLIRFRSGRGPLTFQITAASAINTPPPEQIAAVASAPAPSTTPQPRPSRPRRRSQSAIERYQNVLPRWMRTGQQQGQPNRTTKRRPH